MKCSGQETKMRYTDKINVQVLIGFYRFGGQCDITRSSSLHDSQGLAQVTPTPEEGHSSKDGVYAI